MRTLVAVLFLSLLVPGVIAQAPVSGCARQCSPKASDVNFPPVVEWGGKVNVILYAHMEDMTSQAVLNTAPPNPAFEKDLNEGFLVPAIVTRTPVSAANVNFDQNVFTFRHCPGMVEPTAKRWHLGCHAGALADDIVFAGSEIPVYFYVTPDAPAPAAGPGVAPNVHLVARMSQGHQLGDVVAETRTAGSSTLITRPGQPDVFELRTTMHLRKQVLSDADAERGRGFRVEVAVYQHRDSTAEFQQNFRVRSGPLFPPRIILPILDPVSFVDQIARPSNGTIEYTLRAVSDFGGYDVDRSNATARLHSRGVDLSRHIIESRVIPYWINDHMGAQSPVSFQYVVDAKSIQTEGPLILDFSVPNRQGTFVMHHAVELPFAHFTDASVIPGFSLMAIFLMVLGLALARRRLQRR